MAAPEARISSAVRYEEEPLSLLRLVNALLRRRRFIVGIAGALAMGLVLAGLLKARTWTASASFMPQSARPAANLTALAAQFGFALPSAEPNQSPAFYADLLRSREILGTLAVTMFPHGGGSDSLLDILRLKGPTPAHRRAAAIRLLRDWVSVSTNQRTGVVSFDVTMPDAALADTVARRLLAQLNEFNLRSRQSRAAQERRFAEQRLEEVRSELRQAEDRLQGFLQRNRDYSVSSELRFQQDRLAREVTLRQQVYGTLAQAVEQARIDEVRDTPVITMVERPEAPVRPDRRGLIRRGLLGLMLGTGAGIVFALLADALSRTREVRRNDYDDFVRLRSETFADLRRPWRMLRRSGEAR